MRESNNHEKKYRNDFVLNASWREDCAFYWTWCSDMTDTFLENDLKYRWSCDDASKTDWKMQHRYQESQSTSTAYVNTKQEVIWQNEKVNHKIFKKKQSCLASW